MGLLTALKLPRPPSWPPVGTTRSPVAVAKPVAGESDVQTPATAEVGAERGAEDEPEVPVAAALPVHAEQPAAAAPPVSLQVTPGGKAGKTSITYKKTADGEAVAVKYEQKEPIFKQTFTVGPVPCFTKGDVSLAVEGEVSTKGKTAGLKVQVTAAGSFSIGVGVAKGSITVGPLGTARLSCSQGLAVTYSDADGVAADAFVCEVRATGSVGIEATIDNGPSIKAECKLADWQLLIVHVAGYAKGKFSGMRVEPGKDLLRLIASLQNTGPAIADAVDKCAPEVVKKAAEDGAKWVAESHAAKEIAENTGVVLDKVKKETGVDVGNGAEKVVQFLVDPGGETTKEGDERRQKEAEAFSAAHDAFDEVMQRSGLKTEFNNTLYRTADDYNKIYDTFRAGGEWRPMVEALVERCRARRAAYLKAQAEKKAKEQADADAAAAAELARRVKAADDRLQAAFMAAMGPGNVLNNSTSGTPDAKARKYWETGMMKFWNPGVNARQQVASLAGEARIARAGAACDMFGKAQTVFQEGLAMR